MELDDLSKNLLKEISGLHRIPSGAVSFRENGKNVVSKSTQNIEIFAKEDGSGIDVYVHSSCNGEACHLPVIVSESGLHDLVYNDFYIENDAKVTIVAGCGVHSDNEAGHDGIHSFHIGKNAEVTYIENHLATGSGAHKEMSPTTIIDLGEGASMVMNTTQLGGVDYASRNAKVVIGKCATLQVNEKILTSRFNVAKTNFKVTLKGMNSKCYIVSRSVAKDESEQIFKSELVGCCECFGRVECDGIVLDNARIDSVPKISAKNRNASLSHEAEVGKIAGDQIVKLMTLGLSEKQAEEKIINSFLK